MRRNLFISFLFFLHFVFHLFLLISELDKISRHGFRQLLGTVEA